MMAVSALARIVSLTAARKVLLQPPHHSLSLPAPSHHLSLSFHHACQPQIRARLWHKGTVCFQVNPAVRVKSAKAYCQTIVSCRNARKNLLQGIHRAIRKSHRLGINGGRMAWCGTSLGMAFLAPSVLCEAQKEIPVLAIQPEVRRKKRGWGPQLLLSVYEFLCVCLRALRLLATFTPILMLYPITYLGRTATDAWWGLLLTGIECSGPILIKLGQWASTRKDLFPESCCSQFSRLQRRIKPHPWCFTVHQMKRAFGPHWRKVFVKFDNDGNPIGSGCVAQVYKVWMSSGAIADEEVLGEILSEMDDDTNAEEGHEVLGLSHLFHLGAGLLGFGRETDPDNLRALEEYQRLRDERRSMEGGRQGHRARQEAQDTQELTSPSEAGQGLFSLGRDRDNSPPEEGETDVSSRQAEDTAQAQQAEDVDDAPAHLLLEEWQEGELDKSLPLCEAPPDALEGLVPVAVKVLHPGIALTFRRDLRILRACADLITALAPPLRWLSLPQCVDEFAQVLSAQINMRTEADNLEKFSENFCDIPIIRFPRPLRPYVTTKVLVETFEEGENMLDVMRAPEDGDGDGDTVQLKKHLAKIGVDALLKMVFVDNLVHGDLHPGNLLVQNITSGATTGDQVRRGVVSAES
ncbi:putative aarF domain-containing protein kinase 2 [Chionoecetes opilio]|uniref:Putative aarF domain-containing protein kinase 2 n=1 Tax=Chionoecetes opilio TaxID=41210 RepID=A0A8J4XPY9_CHIOP|nr:putative aarF domain-containing protein kinase 2 [Chionoecetes opilio]